MVTAGVVENQLPADGVYEHLTAEQTTKLKQFWSEFYTLIDNAPKYGSADPNAAKANAEADTKGSDKPPKASKDDAARDRQRQEQELRDARAALEKYGSKRFVDTFWRFVANDIPDVMALKFLRARKWEVNAGVAMLAACMKWRIESDVEDIVRKGEEGMKDADGFIRQMEIGKSYTHGTDKQGRPVCYILVRIHRLFDQSAKALEDFVLYQMESVRCLFTYPIDKITMIFDMTGFGLANMDWRCILFIVKCLEAYYPESLNSVLVHNAPWLFQGIWRILAPMLDPVVRAKVQFTKNTEDLQVHIHKDHLIKQLGGVSEWKWEYEPIVPGENSAQSDEAGKKAALDERESIISEHERLTRAWIDSDDADLGKARKAVDYQCRVQSFELDPYVRGRGIYHRKGNIVGNGLVTFHYPGLEPEKEWEVTGHSKCKEQLEVEIRKLTSELQGNQYAPKINVRTSEADPDAAIAAIKQSKSKSSVKA